MKLPGTFVFSLLLAAMPAMAHDSADDSHHPHERTFQRASELVGWCRQEAEAQTRAGIRRLYMLADSRALNAQVAWLPELKQLMLYAASLMSPAEFQEEVHFTLVTGFVVQAVDDTAGQAGMGQPVGMAAKDVQQAAELALQEEGNLVAVGPLCRFPHGAAMLAERILPSGRQLRLVAQRLEAEDVLEPQRMTCMPQDVV